MAGSDFKIRVHDAGGCRVLCLSGRFSPEACDQLRTAVENEIEKKPTCMLVELTGLANITSCGIGTLIWMESDCKLAGCRMMLVNDNTAIGRVLTLTGLDDHFTIARTVTEALK